MVSSKGNSLKKDKTMDERDIPFFLVQKIRMKYVVPIIRAMEETFGKDPVHTVLEQRVVSGIEQARNAV